MSSGPVSCDVYNCCVNVIGDWNRGKSLLLCIQKCWICWLFTHWLLISFVSCFPWPRNHGRPFHRSETTNTSQTTNICYIHTFYIFLKLHIPRLIRKVSLWSRLIVSKLSKCCAAGSVLRYTERSFSDTQVSFELMSFELKMFFSLYEIQP